MRTMIVLLMLLLVLPAFAAAEMTTGKQFLSWTEDVRMAHTVGVTDALIDEGRLVCPSNVIVMDVYQIVMGAAQIDPSMSLMKAYGLAFGKLGCSMPDPARPIITRPRQGV